MNDLLLLWRHTWAGLRLLLAATLALGVLYPLLVTGASQAWFGWTANGSMLTADGDRTTEADAAVGSALLGQPESAGLFAPRPSAAGDGYDPLASAGSNLGPTSPDLVALIGERRAAVASRDGVDPAKVPADALTASGSGLDPHISPAFARLQVDRVARAQGLSPETVGRLVREHTQGRAAGILGAPHVNVLQLNLAVLAESSGS